jgi:hypothetical protein
MSVCVPFSCARLPARRRRTVDKRCRHPHGPEELEVREDLGLDGAALAVKVESALPDGPCLRERGRRTGHLARARDKEVPVKAETAGKGRTRREVGRGALWNAEKRFRSPPRRGDKSPDTQPCTKGRTSPSLPAPAITTDGIPPPPPLDPPLCA